MRVSEKKWRNWSKSDKTQKFSSLPEPYCHKGYSDSDENDPLFHTWFYYVLLCTKKGLKKYHDFRHFLQKIPGEPIATSFAEWRKVTKNITSDETRGDDLPNPQRPQEQPPSSTPNHPQSLTSSTQSTAPARVSVKFGSCRDITKK